MHLGKVFACRNFPQKIKLLSLYTAIISNRIRILNSNRKYGCVIPYVSDFIRKVMSLDIFNVLAEKMIAMEPYLVAVYLLKLGLVQQGLSTDFTSWDVMTCILEFLKLSKSGINIRFEVCEERWC